MCYTYHAKIDKKLFGADISGPSAPKNTPLHRFTV